MKNVTPNPSAAVAFRFPVGTVHAEVRFAFAAFRSFLVIVRSTFLGFMRFGCGQRACRASVTRPVDVVLQGGKVLQKHLGNFFRRCSVNAGAS